MSPSAPESTKTLKVVVNHEEQYSIWPSQRANALGWHDAGFSGTREQCLEFINKTWTDMRPMSIRRADQRP